LTSAPESLGRKKKKNSEPSQPPPAAPSTPPPEEAAAWAGSPGRPSPEPLDSQALSDANIAAAARPRLGTGSPSMRWRDDPVSVEDVFPTPKASRQPAFEILEGLQPFSAAVQGSERLRSIMRAVSDLSHDAFEEDAQDMVTRKARWKMTLLVCPEGSEELSGFSLDGPPMPLIGFLVYRLRPELQCLSIAKLAITPEHRRQGHGCRLIEWCVRLAKKQPNVAYIALSSLPEAVRFYQRMGFRKFDIRIAQDQDDLVEGQVYMEKQIKGRRRK